MTRLAIPSLIDDEHARGVGSRCCLLAQTGEPLCLDCSLIPGRLRETPVQCLRPGMLHFAKGKISP